MLTKLEILKLLKMHKVDMGKNPDRTFTYYQLKGLIPYKTGVHSKNRKIALYPNNTFNIIKNIRSLQEEGKSLSEIKNILIKEEMSRIEHKSISYTLGLEEEGQIYKTYPYLIIDDEGFMYVVITAVYSTRIDWYKVKGHPRGTVKPQIILIDNLPYSHIGFEVVDHRRMSNTEYKNFIGSLAMRLLKDHKEILDIKEIMREIFE